MAGERALAPRNRTKGQRIIDVRTQCDLPYDHFGNCTLTVVKAAGVAGDAVGKLAPHWEGSSWNGRYVPEVDSTERSFVGDSSAGYSLAGYSYCNLCSLCTMSWEFYSYLHKLLLGCNLY